MKKKYIVIVVVILIIGFLLSKFAFGNKEEATIVETVELDKSNIIETVSGTGKIQPEIEIKISSEVSGEIINLPIKEGQVVHKGDLLVVINPDLYTSAMNRMDAMLATSKAGLSQAEAQLKETKSNYDRNSKLYDKGVISRSEWDQVVRAYEVAKAAQTSAYYNVESAKAALAESKGNLLRTTIYAPAYGTISKVNVELGERVLGTQQMAGTEILRVANLSSMEVEVDINENDIVKVKLGDETRINVDAYLKKEFRGVVTSISNSASNTTLAADQVTTFKVKIKVLKESYEDLLNKDIENYSPFRPGMTAAVDIITNVKNDILAVPISAVVMKTPTDTVVDKTEGKKVFDKELMREAVFVNDKGVAKLRFVKTGIQDDTNIQIISGLKKDDVIITGPYSTVSRTLQHGAKVEVESKK
ncbi:MAG: efflux RND transporter periplasmic adaptor subunit [Myroides sp.]|jgi:HlyD family secretion protein|uniref:Efflux transporter periplasmic adaptor subunit n=1 Tax=Myroides marinus TaxID=703342 RepID=A0A163W6W9_9FLAO|nr:efflux RND transporter periplasmic adaptor subunit [Myroides marinus]MDR0196036.1 efflux RND transporter periplasmic adaptor subunit [Myroides sp.]KUF41961.1 efflux transporter periplasmic adaptor subunit [Myroides marinus]KZE75951.1 efflux transporter periplasmic adaptor subunit [Myroides marinus]MDM1371229.1 efflux RND transporter periplasmic adaptor subunit [Myroides marinus]MDM1378710.1 efflux RND transporter periplasmic adaptor subunit [Myroides marinus]